jgi:hypothetical protein
MERNQGQLNPSIDYNRLILFQVYAGKTGVSTSNCSSGWFVYLSASWYLVPQLFFCFLFETLMNELT